MSEQHRGWRAIVKSVAREQERQIRATLAKSGFFLDREAGTYLRFDARLGCLYEAQGGGWKLLGGFTPTQLARRLQGLQKVTKAAALGNLRTAAQVGTDSASIWAIAPEQALRAGPKLQAAWDAGDFERADTLVRQHGGSVFHTGGDGTWEVKVDHPGEPGQHQIREKGLMEPYGTPGYDELIKKVAAQYMAKGKV